MGGDRWQDLIEPRDEADDRRVAGKLANYLGRERGDRATKVRWLMRQLPLIEAEADKLDPQTPRAKAAAVRSLVVRYWRYSLERAGSGRGRPGSARYATELPRQSAPRGRSGKGS